VNEPDLIGTLREGRIAGAGLDVLATEPIPVYPLLEMDNVVLSPHLIDRSEECVCNTGRQSAAMCRRCNAEPHRHMSPIRRSCRGRARACPISAFEKRSAQSGHLRGIFERSAAPENFAPDGQLRRDDRIGGGDTAGAGAEINGRT